MGVDLALEVECASFVGDVTWDDEHSEAEPEEESEYGEEGAVVEEDTGPADEGGDDTDGGGESGEDEFWAVTDANDICVGPDVEPGEETEDHGYDGVDGELVVLKDKVWGKGEGRKETHEDVGDEESPLESIPTQFGFYITSVLATKPACGDAVIILVVLAWDTSFATPESLYAATAYWIY